MGGHGEQRSDKLLQDDSGHCVDHRLWRSKNGQGDQWDLQPYRRERMTAQTGAGSGGRPCCELRLGGVWVAVFERMIRSSLGDMSHVAWEMSKRPLAI